MRLCNVVYGNLLNAALTKIDFGMILIVMVMNTLQKSIVAMEQ